MDLKDEGLHIGISEKKDGPMKTHKENRLLFFERLGLDDKVLVSSGMLSSNKVAIVNSIYKDEDVADCDALITDQDKFLLAITVADCLPIYFYDRTKKVVAIAQAGWRGVVSRIVHEVINLFVSYYDCDSKDIEVFIGPHIKDCHFGIRDDIVDQFNPKYRIERNGEVFVNMSKIVIDQLLLLGVFRSNISVSEECTYCLEDKYYSFRRNKPKELETMIAYIGLK